MQPNKSTQWLSIALILTLLGNMILLPGAAKARQEAAMPPAMVAVVNSGERYMDALPLATGNALKLTQMLDYIGQADLETLGESTLVQARGRALETAQQAAVAQGAVGATVDGLAALGFQAAAAVDMDSQAAALNSSGFEAELETALSDLGLTASQINQLESATAGNFTVRRSPLPTETVTLLQTAGLTSTQITQIEQALNEYGLAGTQTDLLAQLRASQAEMSIVRTEALVAYIQLLTQQVLSRQLAGQTGREVAAGEVETIVKDQLRLLIHTGYLDSLWAGNPDPDVGEGQWLFIERYSLRVAERLEALILETHNLGLVVDLLVALQLHGTALAALAGDAAYAKAEMDPLADLLATLTGDSGSGGLGYRQARPPFWWSPALALGQFNPAYLYEPAPEAAAVTTAQSQAQQRVRGLAAPLWFPQAQGGFNDPNPANNVAQALFFTLPPDIPAGLLETLIGLLGGDTPAEFLWAILTGQTDDPYAIGGNIILSSVPIEGEILDAIALFTEPSPWGKAFAFIGLVASLASDGAQLITALGALFPPALLALPAAVATEVIDIGAALLKNANRFVTPHMYGLIKNIPFEEALRLGQDILGHLGRRAYNAVGGNWPASPKSLLDNTLPGVWKPFETLLTYYGNNQKWGQFFKLGFGDGSFLAGRVLQHSDEAVTYGDEVIEGVAAIGDELGGAAADLSDEAAVGLGKLVDDVGGEKSRRFLAAIPCTGGITDIPARRSAGLASPLLASLCAEAVERLKTLSPEAHDGLQRLLKTADEAKVAQVFNEYDDTLRAAFFSTFAGVDESLLKNMVAGIDGDLVRLEKYLSLMGDAGELDDLIRVANRGGNLGIDGIDQLAKIAQDTPGVDFKRVKQLAIEGGDGSEIFKATQLREVKVGLAMETLPNGLRGPIKRPLDKKDFSHDFIDGSNQKWDIKSLHSGHNNYKTPEGIDEVLGDVQDEFTAGERVVIDVTDVSDEDAVNLFIAVLEQGWRNDRIKWYIPPERETLLGLLY